ncbi:MAG: HEPN domain-containing protein [Phycisphaerales bacterium]|nr:HEPN domain-containing protein [Phycisphaerales bacterium]
MTEADDRRQLVKMRLEQARQTLKDGRSLLAADMLSTRSVVNRAYYAAFYAVMALLQTIGKVPRKHQGAISLFELEFVKTGELPKEMSKWLRTLFRMRMDDDYMVMEDVTVEEAEQALGTSERMIEAIGTYLVKTDWIHDNGN